MPIRCVALLSGGLDSMLAIRVMQSQGIEVEALNFQTLFTCCQARSAQAAHELGVRLTVLAQENDYLDIVREPRFGRGRGANPCVDCRIYMFDKARRFMDQVGAQFLISGEIIGQRPMSQKRRDLERISYHSQTDDLLLRPLSAKLLPPTLPERQGWVAREAMYDITGRSRKRLIQLARHFGLSEIPAPSTGCALTEPRFSNKVFDLLAAPGTSTEWDFELLKVGRHFRFDQRTKVVVGRNEVENEQLLHAYQLPLAHSSSTLSPENFRGPRVLLVGPRTDDSLSFAIGLLVRFSQECDVATARVCIVEPTGTRFVNAAEDSHARTVASLAQ